MGSNNNEWVLKTIPTAARYNLPALPVYTHLHLRILNNWKGLRGFLLWIARFVKYHLERGEAPSAERRIAGAFLHHGGGPGAGCVRAGAISVRVETPMDVVHIARIELRPLGCMMDELNGRMMACQILVTGLIARVANNSTDPLRFLTDFRDEIKAVVKGVNISGMDNTDRVRQIAQSTVDELFSLMKPPSED
jgi:hypothetical protein